MFVFNFSFVLLCLVLQYGSFTDAIEAGNVLNSVSSVKEVQVILPWHKDIDDAKPKILVIKSAEGKEFKVKCAEYEDQNPRVYVYTPEDILIDHLTLYPLQDPCEETKINTYIIPQSSVLTGKTLEVKIHYQWASKLPRCVERTYTIHRSFMNANVFKSDYPSVECPGQTKTLENGVLAGGIVNLGPMDTTNDMRFFDGVEYQGDPKAMEIRKDYKDKTFTLICQDGNTKAIKTVPVTTAFILHETYDNFVIDKFSLKTCSKEGININRLNIAGIDSYKVVFKSADGKCYQRSTLVYRRFYMYYYEKLSIIRERPLEVACLISFEGDIGLNTPIPWHKKLFTKRMTLEGDYSLSIEELIRVFASTRHP